MFNFNIDAVVFGIFLVANLGLGLFSSRGITTIKEYAVGDRKFSTAVIVSTIVATWIGGHDFVDNVSEVHSQGLSYIWSVVLGDWLCIALVGLFFSVRMGEFLGKLSIAEAMGDMFGRTVRIVTAVCGFIGVAGMLAVQFKVAGKIAHYAFGISNDHGIILAATIVTLYSALGGIKAVAFTDVIQLVTFSITIPLISYFLLHYAGMNSNIISTLSNNPLYDYKIVFDFTRPESLEVLFLFIFFGIPGFSPAIFQRVAIAKDTLQIREAFVTAGTICAIIVAMLCWVGVIISVNAPQIATDDVVQYLLNQVSIIPGFKGLILAGIMAMVMSTVDSYINCSSVLIVHDFCNSLNLRLFKSELLSARLAAMLVGILSVLIAMREGNWIEIITFAFSFYMPLVTVPFIMAILGFRSSAQSVILGMIAGAITVICGHYFELKINPIPPAMLMNLIVLFASHYLLRQKGGWVGIKDRRPLERLRQEREMANIKFWKNVRDFTITKLLQRNCPEGDGLIAITGFFLMISVFGSVHNLDQRIYTIHEALLSVVYPLTLVSSAILIGYPLWLQSWKDSNAFPYIWNVIMFWVLIVFSFFIVLLSGFAEIQLIVFMVNLLIISSLIRWRWAFINIVIGCSVAMFLHKHYVSVSSIVIEPASSQFNTIYLLLLVSSALVLFLKPKEGRYTLSEEKVEHLSKRIDFQNEEIDKLTELKYEFLRNIQHEARTPIAGITNLSEILWLRYDDLSEEQRRKTVEMIASSGERLKSLIFNFIDVSQLSSLKFTLTKKAVDLGAVLKERIQLCDKFYIEEKDSGKREFIVDIDENLLARCDEYYMSRVFDNLIANAIKYCKVGKIEIALHNVGDNIEFTITDEGIGIPDDELDKIFGVMVVSSRTRTPAGGRGVGLALCSKAIELHRGKIWAERVLKNKGSRFKFIIPKV